MFLAKSYPFEESLIEHTDNLIANFDILKELYGSKIDVNWDLLKIACLYHDMGKVNRVFQQQIKHEKVDKKLSNIPHGYLSVLFLNHKNLKKDYGFTKYELIVLINAVAHHHKRKDFDEDMIEIIINYFEHLKEDLKNFEYHRLPNLKEDLNISSLKAIYKSSVSGFSPDEKYDYILLKGLLNKIDYAASGHYKIEYPNDFLEKSLEKLKEKWGKNGSFNELQIYMKQNSNKNIVAIAETGYGKTEAALLWIGNSKGFFTLPLKSAINQIYERVKRDIVNENIENKVGLLHSDNLSEYFLRNNNEIDKDILNYRELTNELSLPLTICTIDQIFDFVYKYVGFERKLATLSYSKIVIDEIQMYSPDLVAYVISAIEEICKVGGQFAILTATFPPFIKDLLLDRNIEFEMPKKPFLKENRIRHSIKLKREVISAEFISQNYHENKVLVIVNTIKKLNEIYDELSENYGFKNDISVFHSQFIKKDRAEKERKIIQFGQKENNQKGIWICTQVAEASLDIDFDLLITELSDLNGLFQRMGRCYRKRKLDKDYNIFVFDGGEEVCSGVGSVNDKEIFLKSKEALRNINEGPISEKQKIELIDEIYSKESLKETKYFKDINRTLNYLNSIYYDELKKSDVVKCFRQINSINIIPKPVYLKYKTEIDNLIEVLSSQNKNLRKEELLIEKNKAKIELESFQASIPYYSINKDNLNVIDIGRYEKLYIYDCEYSSEFGLKHFEVENKIEESELFF